MVLEAQREREERLWREAHFGKMAPEAQEMHARRYPVYGALSQAAQREGLAMKRLARMRREGCKLLALVLEGTGIAWCDHTPRTGRSVPEAPLVKTWRYPRQRAVQAWLRILAGQRGSKDEVVTAADRTRRKAKRVARSLLRVAPVLVKSRDGLAAMERLIEAIRRRQDGAAA